MLHYVYYPFEKDKIEGPIPGRSMNQGQVGRYVKKYAKDRFNTKSGLTAEQVMIYKPSPFPANRSDGPLAKLKDNDMLLIGGHGHDSDADKGKLSSQQGHKITHSDLADDLFNLGLPTSHKLIKMISCFGAGILMQTGGGTVERQGNDHFACLLAKSLRQRHHYNDILVAGYPGAVMTGHNPRKKNEARTISNSVHLQVSNGASVVAHDYIVWFDGLGAEKSRDAIKAIKTAVT